MTSCLPGLACITTTDRSPNVFDGFFPMPTQIGNMRQETDFTTKHAYSLNAPICFIKGVDEDKKEFSVIVYKESGDLDEDLTDVLHQMEMITELNNANVLKFYEFVSGKDLTDVAYVFEPIDGFLSEIIQEDIPALYGPTVIKRIMQELFTALAYLHQKDIMHVDVQPENIAFTANGVLKLWNFQTARRFYQKPRKLRINEFRYQCVDLLLMSRNYDESVDIWSANCIFAELCLKKSIFPKHGRERVISAIFRLLGFPKREIWEEFCSIPGADNLREFSTYKFNMLSKYFKKYCDNITPSALDLIHRCFRYNPKYRPSAEQCLLHPYFYEQPEACSASDIVSILQQKTINQQIRMIRIKHQ